MPYAEEQKGYIEEYKKLIFLKNTTVKLHKQIVCFRKLEVIMHIRVSVAAEQKYCHKPLWIFMNQHELS